MPVTLAAAVALHSTAAPAPHQPQHAQVQKAATSTTKVPAKQPARTVKNVTVKAGDTVYSIAKAQHSSVAAIVKANPRIEFRRLLPGTVLRVPAPAPANAPKPAAKPAPTPSPKPTKAAPHPAKTPARTTRNITVHRGDSLYVIAKREHVSLAGLIKANPGLSARRLVPGSTIRIPLPPSATPAPKPGKPAQPAAKPAHAPTPPTPSSGFAPKPTHVVRYAGTAAARLYPASVVASGDRHRAELAKANLPNSAQIRSMIEQTARRYGVDPTLALAIAWQESGHQQSAVSVCDALGTMQVMPTTGSWAGQIIHQHLDLLHAQDNITAGMVTLRYLTQHAANKDQVIGAYYQGLGAVRAHGFYPDTRQYVASVHAHMKRFAS